MESPWYAWHDRLRRMGSALVEEERPAAHTRFLIGKKFYRIQKILQNVAKNFIGKYFYWKKYLLERGRRVSCKSPASSMAPLASATHHCWTTHTLRSCLGQRYALHRAVRCWRRGRGGDDLLVPTARSPHPLRVRQPPVLGYHRRWRTPPKSPTASAYRTDGQGQRLSSAFFVASAQVMRWRGL